MTTDALYAITLGLFGATNTTGGLFGNNNASTSTSGFGASTSGFGFGASTSTGGGLFGGNTSSAGLFGNTQNQSAFGAKPSGINIVDDFCHTIFRSIQMGYGHFYSKTVVRYS